MSDSSVSSSSSGALAESKSFFEMVTGRRSGHAEADRVRELKRILFDLAYLVMNADGTEHVSEKMLVRQLERRMEREGSVDIDARAEALAGVLDEGADAIRDRILELADAVHDRADDRMQAIGEGYLEFLRGLIVADASVTATERELFEALCDRWEIEKELPGS